MKINGKKFVVYSLDTPATITERIAKQENTLPKYIYFPDGNLTPADIESDKNIRVENLFNTIKNYPYENNIYDLLKDIRSKNSKLSPYQDVLVPYILYNEAYDTNDDNQAGFILLVLQSNIDNDPVNSKAFFTKKVNVTDIWKSRKIDKAKFAKEIAANKELVNETVKKLDSFQSATSDIEYTEFNLENVTFDFSLSIPGISISELFNRIILAPGVPVASWGGMYKILKDFIPPPGDNWKLTHKSAIFVHLSQKVDVSTTSHKDYTKAMIVIDDKVNDSDNKVNDSDNIHDTSTINNVKVRLELDILSSNVYLTREGLIERLLSVFSGLNNTRYSDIKETKVNGVFYVLDHGFNKFIFSDMTMNNTIFSDLASIDEYEKASKKKNSVYWHFYHPSTGHMSVNITGKIVEKGDVILQRKDTSSSVKLGAEYVRVKIAVADNVESVAEFQVLFGKLLGIYDNEFDSVFNFYKKYIPTFTKNLIKSKKQAISTGPPKLRDIAPEVFVKGYPPKCPKPPTIVSDEEAEQAKAEGKAVLVYPKTDQEGFPQRNYICPYENAKFPSLRSNPLSNKDLVPFLVCCYEKDHSEKRGSIYRHYYYGEELSNEPKHSQQDLIQTNKFLPLNIFGIIPSEAIRIFDMYDYSEDYKYVRKGVSNTMSSFIECVMEGMLEKLDTNTKVREKITNRIRQELNTPEYIASCKQEMYDFTDREISEYILDQNKYFDPRYFLSLLENKFNCNIYVFSRAKNSSCQLIIPRHMQGYYKRDVNRPTVLVYEHYGSTKDNSKIPRCELIVKWEVQQSENLMYNFPYKSRISKGIRKVYNELVNTYSLTTKIVPNTFTIPGSVKLLEQGIDSYGKCRILKCQYEDGTEFTLLTTPMQPFIVKETRNLSITSISVSTALSIAASMGITITEQRLEGSQVKELDGIISNTSIHVSIPINNGKMIQGVPEYQESVSFPVNTDSMLTRFNRYKKLSRYVLEYVFWLFSRYVNQDENRNSMDDSVVSTFARKHMIVDTAFEYPELSKNLTTSTPLIRNGDSIVVKSEETKKRLVYALRVEVVRNRKKVLQYHTRQVIENYYVDITDFDHYHNQVILEGDNSIDKWIVEQSQTNVIHDSIIQGYSLPYFFKNSLINQTEIYLAQNANSIELAFGVFKTWQNSHYNPGYDVDEVVENNEFILYSYENRYSITEYKIPGNKPLYGTMKVIGYKDTDNNARFVVLLDINNI